MGQRDNQGDECHEPAAPCGRRVAGVTKTVVLHTPEKTLDSLHALEDSDAVADVVYQCFLASDEASHSKRRSLNFVLTAASQILSPRERCYLYVADTAGVLYPSDPRPERHLVTVVTMATQEEHMAHMRKALKEALSDDCVPLRTAFCVGCVLVTRLPGVEPVTLATGYSRELPGNTHAEANALTKAFSLSKPHIAALFSMVSPTPSIEELMRYTDAYTTLEPCSIRTSGLPACADALIKAGIRRCVVGVGEPDDFVRCEGAQRLKDAGVDVIRLRGLEKQCLDAARKGR